MGKIWEHNNCVVLFWNKENHVIGLKVEKKGEKLTVLDTASSSPETERLAIALSEVENKLVATETHLMLAGCDLSGSVSFDINIPKMSVSDMRQAISYELPRHIPCDPMDVVFGYRVISPKDDVPAAKRTVRILVVMKKQWNELLSELTGSGIKIDAFITPFLAIDPLFENYEDVCFSDSETTISFSSSSEYPGRRIIVKDSGGNSEPIDYKENIKKMGFAWGELPPVIKKDPESYFSGLLISAYGVSPEFALDKSSLVKLPSELFPERYRTLRTSFFAIIGAIIFLVLMLVGRFWWESVTRYNKIKDEITQVNIKTRKVQSSQTRLKAKTDLINDITEKKKGNPEIVTCLYKITQELSKDIWLSHFQSRDHAVDISFRYTKSGLTLPNFNKTGIFNTITSSSRSNPRDGSKTEYVRLEYIPPEKRNE